MRKILEGAVFWASFGAVLYIIRPRSSIHRTSMASLSRKQLLWIRTAVALVIAAVVFASNLSPMWNGTINEYKDQYERITESFLNHRLDFDIPVDPRLLEMENPYDTQMRDALEVPYILDHAYYEGHYYMYFGVVPVFLAFLPYRLLTGEALLSAYASQFFAGIFIIGLAVYFLWLAKRKFPQMTVVLFILLLVLFSLLSVVYVAKFPALYQTPIACGMMLEVWSLYFFSKAVWEERTERSAVRWAFGGSLLGALTFGCRPPLALANLLVIPLICQFLKGRKFTLRQAGRLLAAGAPYILVAAGLMWYNYVRFGNPLEFGQRYQLTNDDQTGLGRIYGLNDFVRILAVTWNTLFALPGLETDFPFLPIGIGAVASCPVLLFFLSWLRASSRSVLKEKRMLGFSVTLCAAVVTVVLLQAMWVPLIVERHKSDVLYLLSIGAFIGIGGWMTGQTDRISASWKGCLAAFLCIVLVVMLFLVPDDLSYTAFYPGTAEWLWSRITFNLSW